METTKRCPHCGATLPEGSLYCFKCGTKLEILDDSDINYSQFANDANTSVDPQDQNIPIDDLLGQTHVINSLMSELDDIVKGDGTDLPVMPSVKQVKDEEPVMPSTPVEKPAKQVNKVEETSPFAWEIPSFSPTSNVSEETEEETIQEDTRDVPERPVLSRSARRKQLEDTDPYDVSSPSTFEDDEEDHTVPPVKKEKAKKRKSFFFMDDDDEDEEYEEETEETPTIKKEKAKKHKSFLFEDEDDEDYDDEEDFEDEYEEKHIWPIVLGVILLIIVVGTVLLVFFKPSIINKGIDGVNNIFHTEIKHLGATEEPLETITPVTPTPEAIDTTIYDAEHNYFSSVSHLYVSFYAEYINAYNTGDIQSLNHVTDSLKAEIQDRYTNYNSGLGFESQYTYVDLDSYVISDVQEDGYYNISFNTYQENRCWDKETNEEKDNNPTMAISMRYNPETGDYYLSAMKIDSGVVLGTNMIDITNW